MSDAQDAPQLYLMTPAGAQASTLGPQLAAVMDAFPVACLRIRAGAEELVVGVENLQPERRAGGDAAEDGADVQVQGWDRKEARKRKDGESAGGEAVDDRADIPDQRIDGGFDRIDDGLQQRNEAFTQNRLIQGKTGAEIDELRLSPGPRHAGHRSRAHQAHDRETSGKARGGGETRGAPRQPPNPLECPAGTRGRRSRRPRAPRHRRWTIVHDLHH